MLAYVPSKFLTRTNLCKHKECHSCLQNALVGFCRTFTNVLSLKVVVNSLFYVGNFKKLLQNLASVKTQKDNIQFALFYALMNLTYKALLCLFRRKFTDDRVGSVVAAIVSGVWLLLEPRQRHELLVIIIFSRAASAAANMSVNKGVSPSIPYLDMVICILSWAQQQWFLLYETESLNKGQCNFLMKWGFFTENEIAMQQAMHRMTRQSIA